MPCTTLRAAYRFKLLGKEVSFIGSSDISFEGSNGVNPEGSLLGDGDPMYISEGTKDITTLVKLVCLWLAAMKLLNGFI